MADNSYIATRKRSNPSTSPIKRLYSVVTLNENTFHKKCMVPFHWVEEEEECVYWPPVGEHPLHYYISKWLSPCPNWQQFPLIKVSLIKGTKEMCNACLNIDSELSECPPAGVVLETSEMIREPSPDLVIKRLPKLSCNKIFKSDQCKRRYKAYSNESESCSSDSHSDPSKVAIKQTKKSKYSLPNSHNTATNHNYKSSVSYFQTSASNNNKNRSPRRSPLKQNTSSHSMLNVTSTPCHKDASLSLCQPRSSQTCCFGNYGDPPSSFKLMDQRRMQYGLFMELAAIKAGQAVIVTALERLGRRIELVDSSFHLTKFDSMEEFEKFDRKLGDENEYTLLVSRLKQLGGQSPSQLVSRCLNELMEKQVQAQFNKMGNKGKKSFKLTLSYKAILAALVSQTNTREVVDRFIGEHLKRAPRQLAADYE
ncbi:uncharacterized protein LOC136076717 [Hydra vulgaris]|uniref:Uncharacterized protein LOC136076717 n=1 Tax=Hydra vulgaris TaxID=6087 RepID=A0ABM4BB60_HYDVU